MLMRRSTDIAARRRMWRHSRSVACRSLRDCRRLKLGWIVAGGPVSGRAAALAGLGLIARQLSLGQHAGAGCGAAIPASNAAPRSAQQIHERVRARTWRLLRAVATSFAGVRRALEGRRRLVGASIRVPATRSEEQLVLDLLDREGDASCIPDISSTFSARRSSSVSLLAARRISFATARRRLLQFASSCNGAGTYACTRPRPGSRRAGALVPASPFLVAELGHRRDRRHRGDRPAGSMPPGIESCSCFRSTKCRRGETSPYSALSAMAIDPQFITLASVEDFAEIGGEEALERSRFSATSMRCASPRGSSMPRCARLEEIWRCGDASRSFAVGGTGERNARRTADFRGVRGRRQAWWLDDYALLPLPFMPSTASAPPGSDWPEPLRAVRQPRRSSAPRGLAR